MWNPVQFGLSKWLSVLTIRVIEKVPHIFLPLLHRRDSFCNPGMVERKKAKNMPQQT